MKVILNYSLLPTLHGILTEGGKISTVDVLVLTGKDRLLLKLKLFFFLIQNNHTEPSIYFVFPGYCYQVHVWENVTLASKLLTMK